MQMKKPEKNVFFGKKAGFYAFFQTKREKLQEKIRKRFAKMRNAE